MSVRSEVDPYSLFHCRTSNLGFSAMLQMVNCLNPAVYPHAHSIWWPRLRLVLRISDFHSKLLKQVGLFSR
jgi:hypothetical protein